jgi:hypothetical protein
MAEITHTRKVTAKKIRPESKDHVRAVQCLWISCLEVFIPQGLGAAFRKLGRSGRDLPERNFVTSCDTPMSHLFRIMEPNPSRIDAFLKESPGRIWKYVK